MYCRLSEGLVIGVRLFLRAVLRFSFLLGILQLVCSCFLSGMFFGLLAVYYVTLMYLGVCVCVRG